MNANCKSARDDDQRGDKSLVGIYNQYRISFVFCAPALVLRDL